MCLCPFLSLARLWSSAFHYPRRRTACGHTHWRCTGRSACTHRSTCAEWRHTCWWCSYAVCLCPFLSLARSWSSSFHYPWRRTACRSAHWRSTGRSTHRSTSRSTSGSTCRSCCLETVLSLIRTCSNCLSLWPVYDVEEVSVVRLFHVALNNSVEEVCCSCSVDELDREVLVACLFCKLSVVVNVLRTDKFSCKDSSRMCYLLVCTVDK